jgi:hypothetical protein
MTDATTMVRAEPEIGCGDAVRCGWDRLEFVEVAVCDDDGEHVVAEPHFSAVGSRPPRKPLGDTALGELMAAAGFEPFVSWIDADAIAARRSRCECGSTLKARGWRRADPRCYRAFAVCSGCGRVHFEV